MYKIMVTNQAAKELERITDYIAINLRINPPNRAVAVMSPPFGVRGGALGKGDMPLGALVAGASRCAERVETSIANFAGL